MQIKPRLLVFRTQNSLFECVNVFKCGNSFIGVKRRDVCKVVCVVFVSVRLCDLSLLVGIIGLPQPSLIMAVIHK